MKQTGLNRVGTLMGCAVGVGILAATTLAQQATPADAAAVRAAQATTWGTQNFFPHGKIKERAAFLGVSAQPADESLSRQLGLVKGTGLLVTHVEPDSPAQGKIEKYDVLRSIEGQVLVNQEQLAVLVRTNTPGNTVTIELTRQAKPMTVTVKLAEREMPALIRSSTGTVLDPKIMRVFGGTNSPVQIKMYHHNLSSSDSSGFAGSAATSKSYSSQFNGQTGVTTMNTDGRTFTLTTEGGKKTLRVITRDGKELFSGPVTTEEDRAKVPGSIKDDLDELDKMTEGINVEFTPSSD